MKHFMVADYDDNDDWDDSGCDSACNGKKKNCGKRDDCEPPDPPFSCEEVLKIIKAALLELLEDSYDEILCRGKARSTARAVRAEVKKLGFDCRYKFVVFVTVSQKLPHEVPLVIKHNLNFTSDGYCCSKHKSCRVFGALQVFGILCTKPRPAKC